MNLTCFDMFVNKARSQCIENTLGILQIYIRTFWLVSFTSTSQLHVFRALVEPTQILSIYGSAAYGKKIS